MALPKLPIPSMGLFAWLAGVLLTVLAVGCVLLFDRPVLGILMGAALLCLVVVSCFASSRARNRIWSFLERLWEISRLWD